VVLFKAEQAQKGQNFTISFCPPTHADAKPDLL